MRADDLKCPSYEYLPLANPSLLTRSIRSIAPFLLQWPNWLRFTRLSRRPPQTISPLTLPTRPMGHGSGARTGSCKLSMTSLLQATQPRATSCARRRPSSSRPPSLCVSVCLFDSQFGIPLLRVESRLLMPNCWELNSSARISVHHPEDLSYSALSDLATSSSLVLKELSFSLTGPSSDCHLVVRFELRVSIGHPNQVRTSKGLR